MVAFTRYELRLLAKAIRTLLSSPDLDEVECETLAYLLERLERNRYAAA